MFHVKHSPGGRARSGGEPPRPAGPAGGAGNERGAHAVGGGGCRGLGEAGADVDGREAGAGRAGAGDRGQSWAHWAGRAGGLL